MADYTTVNDAGAYFKTVLYTGTGSSLGVTGVGFQPDFTWIKNKDAADFHVLTDAVRGVTKYISSNNTLVQATNAESLKTFDSDGFTVGTQAEVNTNTEEYVSWNWKANGAGSANTDGSISSTVSVNATAGFSIVKYVGTGSAATVGHGLGVAPKFIIVRCLDTAKAWTCYHSSLGSGKAIFLEQTAAPTTSDAYFNGVDPTSSVFSIGSSTNVTNSGDDFIAYCFADITGYSKFSSYEGNGNADGAFVYTGFRPAFIICKSIDSTSSWEMLDDKRLGYNVDNDALDADGSSAEGTNDKMDILSNGFKMRTTADPNVAETYIYVACAESPFVNSSGTPTNSR